jgi:hypothetical protein
MTFGDASDRQLFRRSSRPQPYSPTIVATRLVANFDVKPEMWLGIGIVMAFNGSEEKSYPIAGIRVVYDAQVGAGCVLGWGGAGGERL